MSQAKQWNKLDNAAKIFPPTTTRHDTKVFRFVCELTEPVDRTTLQHALDKTLHDFPLYRSVLKKGLFWYYLEESNRQPLVEEENLPACSAIYHVDDPGLLFRVLYYKTRINLEVFHALSDGTGAMHFLRTLVFYYLQERHGVSGQLTDSNAARDQKDMDAFYQYYNKTEELPKARHYKSYLVRGQRLPDRRIGIIEGTVSVASVLEKAHELGATLSEFLVAVLISAIGDSLAVRDQSRPVVITVPVDLRRFFPAQTARNFFGVIHAAYNFKTDGKELETILSKVREAFQEQLTEENLHGIIGRYSSIENNPFVKGIPLQVKIPVLRLAGAKAGREDTAAFSNIGRVDMPEETTPYIRLFSVYVSTRRPQLCLCSFGDRLTISVSSPFINTAIQRHFFRKLSGFGIPVEIISNLEQMGEEVSHAAL